MSTAVSTSAVPIASTASVAAPVTAPARPNIVEIDDPNGTGVCSVALYTSNPNTDPTATMYDVSAGNYTTASLATQGLNLASVGWAQSLPSCNCAITYSDGSVVPVGSVAGAAVPASTATPVSMAITQTPTGNAEMFIVSAGSSSMCWILVLILLIVVAFLLLHTKRGADTIAWVKSKVSSASVAVETPVVN